MSVAYCVLVWRSWQRLFTFLLIASVLIVMRLDTIKNIQKVAKCSQTAKIGFSSMSWFIPVVSKSLFENTLANTLNRKASFHLVITDTVDLGFVRIRRTRFTRFHCVLFWSRGLKQAARWLHVSRKGVLCGLRCFLGIFK